ncbi:MAG: alanine racemase, partial [Planctomycetota bacterium]
MADDPRRSKPHATDQRQPAEGRYEPAARPGRPVGSYLTAHVSASAVAANLAALRRAVPAGTDVCAVVKADAYGHGLGGLLETIAAGADWLAVSTPGEALALRDAGYDGPVLMFFSACAHGDGGERAAVLRDLVARDVTLTVVAPAEVAEVRRAARDAARPARVHVKVDTGMGRSGIPADRAASLVATLRDAGGVELDGLYTHFAIADEPVRSGAVDVTAEQVRLFRDVAARCGGAGRLRLHAANSAATLTRPET